MFSVKKSNSGSNLVVTTITSSSYFFHNGVLSIQYDAPKDFSASLDILTVSKSKDFSSLVFHFNDTKRVNIKADIYNNLIDDEVDK